jgi:hypothetical protein
MEMMVSFTLWPLHPQEKSLWHLLERRLGGPQSRSGCVILLNLKHNLLHISIFIFYGKY